MFRLSLSALNFLFLVLCRINSLMSDLNDKSHQFRIIQKRLLVRYKDRNPAPLNGLELLLSNTYKGVIALSDEIEGNMQLLKKQNLILTCYSKLLVSLAGMKYGLEANDRK